MIEKFITIVIALIGLSEFLDKKYLIALALFSIVIGKLLGFKANNFKRKKTLYGRWFKASIIVTTFGFILSIIHIVIYLTKDISK